MLVYSGFFGDWIYVCFEVDESVPFFGGWGGSEVLVTEA